MKKGIRGVATRYRAHACENVFDADVEVFTAALCKDIIN